MAGLHTHFGFMSGSVKVKLLIMGGVEGLRGLRRWLLGELSTARGRLLDLDPELLSVVPTTVRLEVRVALAGRVMARSVMMVQCTCRCK